MDKQLIPTQEQVIFNDGELELNIPVTNETVWLTQKQLCDIFDKDQSDKI